MQTSDRPAVVAQEQPQNSTELWLKQDTRTEFKTSLCDFSSRRLFFSEFGKA